jgi:hypothetical protein
MISRGKIIFWLSFSIKLLLAVIIVYKFGFNAHFTDNDVNKFLSAGVNFFQHGVFSMSLSAPFVPTMFIPPVYSVFLASIFFVFGKFWVLAVYILQGLLMSWAALYLYRNLRGTVSERSAFWVAVIFAIEPFSNFITNVTTPDSLFAVMLIVGVISFWNFLRRPKNSTLIISSVFLVIATLIKPISQFLPVLFIVIMVAVLARNSFKKVQIAKYAGIYLGIFLILLSPWLVRNKITFNNWNITSLPSYNLYFYNAAMVVAKDNKTDISAAQELLFKKAQKDTAVKVSEDLFNPKYSKYLQTQAFKIILSHKAEYLKLHLLTFGPFFINDGYNKIYPLLGLSLHNDQSITLLLSNGNLSQIKNYLFSRNFFSLFLFGIGKVVWLVIYVFILRHLYLLWKNKERVRLWNFAFFAVVILYFAALTGPVAAASYRMPVQAFIFTLLFI